MSAPGSSNPVPPSFTPGPADPPVDPRTQGERDAWITMDGDRFLEMCNRSLASGNFNYVQTALRVNHAGITSFIAARLAESGTNPPEVSNQEVFLMLRMMHKMNAMLMTVINRAATIEHDARALVTRVEKVEGTTDTVEQINKLAEAIKSGGGKGTGHGKPVSEYKAIQLLKNFSGDRAKFREWNDKLINALAQVNAKYLHR